MNFGLPASGYNPLSIPANLLAVATDMYQMPINKDAKRKGASLLTIDNPIGEQHKFAHCMNKIQAGKPEYTHFYSGFYTFYTQSYDQITQSQKEQTHRLFYWRSRIHIPFTQLNP